MSLDICTFVVMDTGYSGSHGNGMWEGAGEAWQHMARHHMDQTAYPASVPYPVHDVTTRNDVTVHAQVDAYQSMPDVAHMTGSQHSAQSWSSGTCAVGESEHYYSGYPSYSNGYPGDGCESGMVPFYLCEQGLESGACSTGQDGKRKRRRIITSDQRHAANIRERKRMYHLNDAFDVLRKRVPTFAYEKKLSRIETLKLAVTYIEFMSDLVKSKDPAKLLKAKKKLMKVDETSSLTSPVSVQSIDSLDEVTSTLTSSLHSDDSSSHSLADTIHSDTDNHDNRLSNDSLISSSVSNSPVSDMRIPYHDVTAPSYHEGDAITHPGVTNNTMTSYTIAIPRENLMIRST